MATGNMHGDVALWDLSERRLAHIMKNAHDGYITSLTFLHNQPVLVTGATDNSIKVKLKKSKNMNRNTNFVYSNGFLKSIIQCLILSNLVVDIMHLLQSLNITAKDSRQS